MSIVSLPSNPAPETPKAARKAVPAKPPKATHTPEQIERGKLLAQIHLGLKFVKDKHGWTDEDYRSHLVEFFQVDTAKALGPSEMRDLISHFKKWGWQSSGDWQKQNQAKALRCQIRECEKLLGWDPLRYDGLYRKVLKAEPAPKSNGAAIVSLSGAPVKPTAFLDTVQELKDLKKLLACMRAYVKKATAKEEVQS